MSKLPKQNFSSNVLVGYETSDDAGVFKLNEELAIVQTVDFLTPIADDPETYGKIAAINSLNDVYAMGGKPLTALSVVCFPQKGNLDILSNILKGGQEALNQEGVVIIGGHSIDDQEIKFGYTVTGIVEPKRVIRNSTASSGNVLVLTKPIGTGVISTGVKFGKASENSKKVALEAMTTSAKKASEEMQKLGVDACTDVTGFGLLGHAFEMSKTSRTTFKVKAEAVPLLPGVLDLIERKMLTRGDKNNREFVGDAVKFGKSISAEMQSALFDPQTAGGLLISLEEDKAEKFINAVEGSFIIGNVESYTGFSIEVY